MKKLKILAAKIICTMLLGVSSSYAGIPVIDGTNLTQNLMTATEEVAQTLKQLDQYATQINQYQTQLQEYQNMLQNTLQPVTNIWQSANTTMNGLLGTINTINSLQNQYGNLTNFVNKFQNIAGYQQNPCFTGAGCTQAQMASVLNSRSIGSSAQISADAASLQGLDQQQTALASDANTLVQLQGAAQGATGQLQALGYANQLASAQSTQLMQIRGLLIAQQNVLTTRFQAQADQEAQQAAAAAQFRTGAYQASPAVAW